VLHCHWHLFIAARLCLVSFLFLEGKAMSEACSFGVFTNTPNLFFLSGTKNSVVHSHKPGRSELK
jgi:hypothetical protein